MASDSIFVDGHFYKRVDEAGEFTCLSLFKDLGSFFCGGTRNLVEEKARKEKEREKQQAEKDRKELLSECLFSMLSAGSNFTQPPCTNSKEETTKKEKEGEKKEDKKKTESDEGKELFKKSDTREGA